MYRILEREAQGIIILNLMRMNVKRAAECNEQHFVKCLHTPPHSSLLSVSLQSVAPPLLGFCLLNCVRILTPATADQQRGTDSLLAWDRG